MELYAGIDLHSNNSVVTVPDEQERPVFAKRLPNDLATIVSALRSCAGSLRGVAVESTFNWYWLVDGLQDAGFAVHLVNTAAVKQYDGLKHSGDFSDARHLARERAMGSGAQWGQVSPFACSSASSQWTRSVCWTLR